MPAWLPDSIIREGLALWNSPSRNWGEVEVRGPGAPTERRTAQSARGPKVLRGQVRTDEPVERESRDTFPIILPAWSGPVFGRWFLRYLDGVPAPQTSSALPHPPLMEIHMTDTVCYAALDQLVKEASDAAVVAEMRQMGFDGSLDAGFTGWSTLWADAGLPQDEIHISYPDGRVTLLSSLGQDISPPPDGLRLNPVEIFQRWPEWMDLIFYPWYSIPNYIDFTGKVETIKDVVGELAAGGTTVNGAGKDVEIESTNPDLTLFIGEMNEKMALLGGDAMEALKSSYLSRLPVVIGGQFALASVITVGIVGEQDLWKTAEADISKIAVMAKEAFEAAGVGGGPSAFDLLQAAGVVLGIAGLVATGGGATAISALSIAAGIGTSYIVDEPAQPDPLPLAADDVEGVYHNVRDAITTLGDTVMSDQEDALRNAMDNASGVASSDESASTFVFGRPNEFLHEDRPSELFGPETLAVSRDSINFVAGRLQFVAEHLTATLGKLDGVYGDGPWHRSGTMGIGPEGHYFAWSQLVDQLGESLDGARKALHAVAGRMIWVGSNFQATEDQIAADLAQLVDKLPDPTPVVG